MIFYVPFTIARPTWLVIKTSNSKFEFISPQKNLSCIKYKPCVWQQPACNRNQQQAEITKSLLGHIVMNT